ncbi:MAG: nuclear transport factor 2 family protein [Limnohabitans sp.]|nr:nuclear transport factor 2 family protein [Limnohabitans sp.]
MPVTQITLLRGYEQKVHQRLVDHVSKAVRSVIPAPEAGTTTFIQEVVAYQRDGRFFEQGNVALSSATEVVKSFLIAMQARDLAQAQTHLHADFQMVFPGGQVFYRLEDLLAWATTRYQHVEKTFTRFDESWQGDCTVVYCAGNLNGVWLNGTAFQNIRFVDRFEVVAGKLSSQDVWNDLSEHSPPLTQASVPTPSS